MLSSSSQMIGMHNSVMNSNSINLQRNQDFSLTGALQNFLLYVFSIANCFAENIDNCLDNGATIVNVFIKKVGGQWKLIFASNGRGMNKEQLKKAQIISQHSDRDLGEKQGRFGHGYPISRSKFTNNTGLCTWLSCYSPLNDNEKDRKFSTDKFAQCVINMDESMRDGYLVKDLSNEVSRRLEKYWNDFAVDNCKPGVVLIYDLPEENAIEYLDNLNHPDIDKNLMFNFVDVYGPKLKNNEFKLYINGFEINSFPDWPANITATTENYIYSAEVNDDVFPDNCDANKGSVLIQENGVFAIYKKNGRQYSKKLRQSQYTLGELKYTVKSRFCKNKTELMTLLERPLDDIGINVQQNIQSVSETIFIDTYQRNGKKLKISKDDTRLSGDKDKYAAVTDVQNIIIPAEVTVETDKEYNVSINKSEIKRNLISPQINKCIYTIKHQLNKKEFYEKYIEPVLAARRAQQAAQQAAQPVALEEELSEEELSEEELSEEDDDSDDDEDYSPSQDGDNNDEDDEYYEDDDEDVDDNEDGDEDEEQEDDDADDDADDENDGDNEENSESNVNASPGHQTVPLHQRHNGLSLPQCRAKLNDLRRHGFSDTQKAELRDELIIVSNEILRNAQDLRGTDAEVFIAMRDRRESTLDNVIDDILCSYNEWYTESRPTVRGGGKIDVLHREYTSN